MLVAIAGLGWSGVAAPAHAAGPCDNTCLTVIVIIEDHAPKDYSISSDELQQPDVTRYHEYGGYTFSSATSVYKVIHELLPLDDAVQVESVDIVSSGTVGSDRLSRQNLAAPGQTDFANGDPPVFYYTGAGGGPNGEGLQYARPADATRRPYGLGGGELNFLTMTVHATLAPFTPKVTATPSSTKVGDKVHFTVAFDGRGPNRPRFVWTFGDAQVRESCADATENPAPYHAYAAKGPKNAHVAVCEEGQTVPTISRPVEIQVGPRAAASPSPGPPGGGGVHKNGTTNGSSNGSGSLANGSDTTNGRGTTSDGTGRGPGTAEERARAAREEAQAAAEARRTLSQTGEGTTEVAGLVLAADKAVPFTASLSDASPSPAVAATRRDHEIPRDWRWLLGLLPVVLLAGGMVRQTRWLAPRLPQPPWRST